MRKHFKAFLICTLLASYSNLLPTKSFLQEINVSFFLYYLILHISCLVFLIRFRNFVSRKALFIFAFALSAISMVYLSTLLPYYFSKHEQSISGKRFKLLYANVLVSNREFSKLRDLIQSKDPDFVILLEAGRECLQALQLDGRYPQHTSFPDAGTHSISLFSKFPFVGKGVYDIGEDLPKVIVERVLIAPERELSIYAFHTYPPIRNSILEVNRLISRRLATILKHDTNDLVVATDLNASPFSIFYKRFANWLKLNDAMHGYGFQRTWNAQDFSLRMIIDYIFYRGRVQVKNFEVLSNIGSDHFPIFVEFDAI